MARQTLNRQQGPSAVISGVWRAIRRARSRIRLDLFVLVNDVPADLIDRWVHALAENGFSVTAPAGVDLATHSGFPPFHIEQVPAWFARPDPPPLPAPCIAGFG